MKRFSVLRNVRLGVKGLLLHKLRSMLTMLGVLFGVASVIAMLAVGEGASQEALEQIRKLGSTNIIVSSVKPIEEESSSSQRSHMSIYGLLYEDETNASRTFDVIRQSVPVKLLRKEGRLRTRMLELRVVGTSHAWFDLVKRDLLAGRSIAERDVRERANVVVLTEYGARRLLATEETIGESVRIGGEYFEVVGIVRNEEVAGGTIQALDQEVDAYIPITVARERFGDVFTLHTSGSRIRERVELHQILFQVGDPSEVEPVALGLDRMLSTTHSKQDYRISVPLALLRQAEATKRTFNIVLGSIAGISLLVGGIGIMNIMLASVTERTREIGIRRAIGAKRRQVIAQFLVETMVLSTSGGLIGTLVGLTIPWCITWFSGMPTSVPSYSIVLSLGISLAVGVIFGLYPAVRAANLDPIVALRHE